MNKSQESLSESSSVEVLKPTSSVTSISQPSKGINVKEILKSLVAAPMEGMEAGVEPLSYPDPAAKAQAMLPMQFHSFDRWGSESFLWWCFSFSLPAKQRQDIIANNPSFFFSTQKSVNTLYWVSDLSRWTFVLHFLNESHSIIGLSLHHWMKHDIWTLCRLWWITKGSDFHVFKK